MKIRDQAALLLAKAANMLLARGSVSDKGFVDRLGDGNRSASGNVVTVDAALQLSTVWACVGLIAETISALPLPLYERVPGGARKAAENHPLWNVLHDSPNADQTPQEFWEFMLLSLLCRGNAYAAVNRLAGTIVSLQPMLPWRVVRTRLRDGRIEYRYTEPGTGILRVFHDGEVWHLKGLSKDGEIGMSPIMQGINSMGAAMAQAATVGNLHKNALRSPGHYLAPDYLDDDERDKAESMLDRVRSQQAVGRIPLLEGGWKYEPMTLSPQEVELLETIRFSVEDICRWFRMQPVMIGHTQRSTTWGTGLEQMTLGLIQFTLQPYMRRIESSIKKHLLTPVERKRFYAEFNIEGLLRADSAGRAALYAVFASNGLLTRNEIRALENRGPLPGGDVLTVQSAMIPLAEIGQTEGGQAGGATGAKNALLGWLFGGDLAAIIDARVTAAALQHQRASSGQEGEK